MKKLVTAAACFLMTMMVLCLVGCGGPSPDRIAEEYVDSLKNADFAAMKQMSTGGMIQWIDNAERKYDEVARLLGNKLAEKLKEAYDDLKYEVGEVAAEGDKWTVAVKINGQSTTMTLIKLSGKWRIEKFDFPII